MAALFSHRWERAERPPLVRERSRGPSRWQPKQAAHTAPRRSLPLPRLSEAAGCSPGLGSKARRGQNGACLQPALWRGTRNTQKQQCGAPLSLPGPALTRRPGWRRGSVVASARVRPQAPAQTGWHARGFSSTLFSSVSVSHIIGNCKNPEPLQPTGLDRRTWRPSRVLGARRVAVITGVCSGLTVGLQRGQGRVHLHLLLVRLHEGGRAALAGLLGSQAGPGAG